MPSLLSGPLTLLIGTGLVVTGCEIESGSDAPKITYTTAVEHEQYFPIATGIHGGTDCNECHGSFDTFRDFSCIECHSHPETETNDDHNGVPGYTYDRTICYSCHPTGSADDAAVDHTKFFPIGEGTAHADNLCTDCHNDPSDRNAVSCIDCHDHSEALMAGEHGGVPGYSWTTPACLSCHRDGRIPNLVEHESIFPISIQSIHHDATCGDCHREATTYEANCVDCHPHVAEMLTGQHLQVADYAYQSSTCLECHYDSLVFPVATHGIFVISGGPHRSSREGCLRCHPQTRANARFGRDFTVFRCEACHERGEMDGHHRGFAGYAYDSLTCVKAGCHPDGLKN